MKKIIIAMAMIPLLASCSLVSSKKQESFTQDSMADTIDLKKAAGYNIELALNYLQQGQVARAKSKLNRAKRLAPRMPEVYYSYAYFHEQVGEFEQAEKDYRKAIALNPKGGKEHNNYGTFLCRQQRFTEAEAEFKRAVRDQNYNNTAEAWENAGLCVLQIPDIAKAINYFEKALRYDNHRANALLELAVIHFKRNKIQEAREYFAYYEQIASPCARSLLLGIALTKHAGDNAKQARYRTALRQQFPKETTATL